MISFGPAALIGLCVGFLWGIGCSLAILYSIFLAGYRKGIEETMADRKSDRYFSALAKIRERAAKRSN